MSTLTRDMCVADAHHHCRACLSRRRPVRGANGAAHCRRLAPLQVQMLIEDDDRASRFTSDTRCRALRSSCTTLTLGVLGSSVLPMPFALSKTGVLVGFLTMLVVAAANDATSCMLIRAAAATGCATYEELAHAAGGAPLKARLAAHQPTDHPCGAPCGAAHQRAARPRRVPHPLLCRSSHRSACCCCCGAPCAAAWR